MKVLNKSIVQFGGLIAALCLSLSGNASSFKSVDIGAEVKPRVYSRSSSKKVFKRVQSLQTRNSTKPSQGSSNYSRPFMYAATSGLKASSRTNPAPQESLTSSTSAKLGSEKLAEERKGLSWSLGASHNGGFYEDTEQTSSFFVSMAYAFNSAQSVSVAQSFNQVYRVNPGGEDKGFSQNDTVLSINQKISDDFLTAKWNGRLSSTLPISERSHRNDIVTVTTASLGISRSFFENKLSARVSPMARYYFSEFTTTPSSQGSGGGNPLPEYLLGINGSLGYAVSEKFTLTGEAGWSTQYYYQNKYENEVRETDVKNPPKNSYSLGISGSYSITDKWSASISYAHADRYEKPWGTEYLVYNDRVTTWSLGTSYSF